MFAERSVVSAAAAVFIICILLFCGAAPAIEAATSTTLTLHASTTNPAVGQSFTLSGTLMAGTTPLSGKTIYLQRKDPSGTSTTAGTTTTDSAGKYTFTRSESTRGHYRFYVSFTGAPSYSASTSPAVYLTVGT